MCDHCGCRELTPVAALMGEHDRLRELTGLIRSDLAAGDDAAARIQLEEMLVVLGPHVAKEEGSRFPMLRREGSRFPMLRREGSLTDHVEVLEDEHAGLYDAVDDLDDVPSADRWRDGVLALLHELGEHMYKEDFGLFPAALATLDGADWDAMDRWEQEHLLSRPATDGARP